MMNAQLELSFGKMATLGPGERQPRWLHRAHWWFERMRQVVDLAVDWDPAPPPRPEQICLPNVYRALRADAARPAEEQDRCE